MKGVNLEQLMIKLAQLNRREQWMVVLIVVLIFYAIVDFGAIRYISNEIKTVKADIEKVNEERTALSKSINQKSLLNDQQQARYRAMENQKNWIVGQLSATENDIRKLSSGFLPPSSTASYIKTLTRNSAGKLRLVNMNNFTPGKKVEKPSGEITASETPAVFKHGLAIETHGKYWDQVAFLKKLENIPWKTQLGTVELVTLDYPTTALYVEIMTLSSEAVWLSSNHSP